MAYISQEKKKQIQAQLKKVIPTTWRWSLGVNHHSTLVLNIWAADIDFIALAQAYNNEQAERRGEAPYPVGTYVSINHHWYRDHYPADVVAVLDPIIAALNDGNHDRSDSQTDYFDVGWYLDINCGRWDKPFKYLAPLAIAA